MHEHRMDPSNLQSRLDRVFGPLVSRTDNQNPAWMPSTQNIFRSSNDTEEDEDTAAEEYNEHLRREILPGLSMDFTEEDIADEEGFMPSVSFCTRMDEEAEIDSDDITADPHYFVHLRDANHDHRPSSQTQVLHNNIYEKRLIHFNQQQELDEDMLGEDNDTSDDVELPSPRLSTAIFDNGMPHTSEASLVPARIEGDLAASPSSSPRSIDLCIPISSSPIVSRSRVTVHSIPSKSSLKKGPTGVKKRVSFFGVAEQRQRYAPLQQRSSVDGASRGAAVPTKQTKEDLLPTATAEDSNGPHAIERQEGASQPVPDYVINPQSYVKYDFGESIVVGGGVTQLAGHHGPIEHASVQY